MGIAIELPYKPLFDVGVGKPVILLHGLFGSLSNWGHVAYEFTSTHRVIIPRLPLYANPVSKERLDQLVIYLEKFVVEHARFARFRCESLEEMRVNQQLVY